MTAVDARRVVRAGALLGRYNEAGVLSAADVHVAQRLGWLAGEDDERVLLAAALAVRAVRGGSVCVRLDDPDLLAVAEVDDRADPVEAPGLPAATEWADVLAASSLVARGADGPDNRPVRVVGTRVYLDRYWRDEQLVRTEIEGRLVAPPFDVDPAALAGALARLFSAPHDRLQRLAAATAALSRLTVLTGGPGTGKTTTVARLIAALQAVAGPGLRVALAAPTGKAAARLQQAVRAEIDRCDPDDRGRVGAVSATTVHRLLGWRPDTSTRFVHDRHRHLPHDVVVVDESSMVSLPLMARLLEALRPQARLVLVGDPDQLASVEAGAVLGDLVARPPVGRALSDAVDAVEAVAPGTALTEEPERRALSNGIVRLTTLHRFGREIGGLAEAVRAGSADDVLARLRGGTDAVDWVELAGDRPPERQLAGMRADAENGGRALVRAAASGDVPGALAALDSHRVLLAHRRGPAGVSFWAAEVEAWVRAAVGPDTIPPDVPWYPGQPLLVSANDRDTNLYNGDTGVVVADPVGGLTAAFGDPAAPILVRLHRLPAVETVYAMTVHRGQGSSFGSVSVLLPAASSPLLTRELLYTAITRARDKVRLIASEDAVRAAVTRPVRRASGLREPADPNRPAEGSGGSHPHGSVDVAQ